MLGWLKEHALAIAVGFGTGVIVDQVVFKSDPEIRYLPAPDTGKKKKGKKNKKADDQK